ncbi:MAG TPA: hypothetical protein VIG80_10525 [Bacillaceae bacterium]
MRLTSVLLNSLLLGVILILPTEVLAANEKAGKEPDVAVSQSKGMPQAANKGESASDNSKQVPPGQEAAKPGQPQPAIPNPVPKPKAESPKVSDRVPAEKKVPNPGLTPNKTIPAQKPKVLPEVSGNKNGNVKPGTARSSNGNKEANREGKQTGKAVSHAKEAEPEKPNAGQIQVPEMLTAEDKGMNETRVNPQELKPVLSKPAGKAQAEYKENPDTVPATSETTENATFPQQKAGYDGWKAVITSIPEIHTLGSGVVVTDQTQAPVFAKAGILSIFEIGREKGSQIFVSRIDLFRNQWVNAPPMQPPKTAS